MKLVKASLCLLLIAPMASIADEPATRPAATPPGAPPSNNSQAYRIGPDEMRQFLVEHAPNRLEFLDRLPEGGEGRRRVMRLWMDRLRSMMRLKEQDTELYMKMVRQFELQDEAIGLVKKSRPGDSSQPELREKVEELVRMGIRLRQQRIAKLEKQLETEKQRLAFDEGNEDKLVNQQLESIRKEGKELIRRMSADSTPGARSDAH